MVGMLGGEDRGREGEGVIGRHRSRAGGSDVTSVTSRHVTPDSLALSDGIGNEADKMS